MIFPRFALTLALLAIAAFSPSAHAAAAKPTRPSEIAGGYKGAIVVDAATGNVLFEDHADLVNPPASMTKLMTFAVLHDRLKSGAITLHTEFAVTAADAGIGGTQVYLKEKEVFNVEELLYAMMIQSANDASYLLARAAAGSAGAFVQLMNAKAAELGMTHTTFRSPHGLPPANRKAADGDLTTARDYALLCRHLLLHTDVLSYTSTRLRTFGPKRAEPMQMVNHNHLLGKIAGVDGLKTGFTNAAGFCLATTVLRADHRLIIVTLGGSDSKSRDLKVAELIDHGFTALPANSPPFVSGNIPPLAPGTIASPLTPAPLAPVEKTAAPGDTSIKFSIPKKK